MQNPNRCQPRQRGALIFAVIIFAVVGPSIIARNSSFRGRQGRELPECGSFPQAITCAPTLTVQRLYHKRNIIMYVPISPDRMFHVEHLFAFAYMTKGPEPHRITGRDAPSPLKKRAGRWQCIQLRPLWALNIAPTRRDGRSRLGLRGRPSRRLYGSRVERL
jgi:hypothetical protein